MEDMNAQTSNIDDFICNDTVDYVDNIQPKFPSTKILVSQSPVNMAAGKQAMHTLLVNASLDDIYQDSKITCIDNSNIRGFIRNGIHLIKYGTSSLAHKIRGAVKTSLGIRCTCWAPTNSGYVSQLRDSIYY